VSNSLPELLNILYATLPFIAILLLSGKINLSKPKRSRQFILPLVALIYCVVAVLLANKINGLIIYYTGLIGRYIPFIANINLSKWLNYIFNSLIAGAFLVIKGILLPIANKVWSEARFLFNQTSGKFYEHNERMSVWVLKDEFGQAKTLWKGFYWFAVGISAVILALSQLYPRWAFFRTPFYPVFGVLVMGEILFFLSGLTYQEMLSTIAGDDDEYYRIANYGILRRVFHDLFGNRILYDNTADSLFGLSSFEMLDKLAESENAQDRVISRYFTELKEKGHTIDSGFVRSSIDMVNGKSVLINTPFYQDLTAYIVLPLVRRLLVYENALVIVGRDSAASDVHDWIKNGIASMCGTSELWKTGILTEQKNEYDAAVLRFADVYNRRVLKANAEFLNKVSFVLLIEPSRIASTGQIGLSLIVDQLGKKKKNIVYCSCDRNCDGLVDTLSHILKVNLTEVYATVPTLANCSLMYWNAYGAFLHHKILSNIAHYLGVGTELSAVALKHQIANTVWVSSERFPVLDMRWIAGQYYNAICAYIGYPKSQESFVDVFKVDANLWDLSIRDNAFLTVEDEFNNLFEMTRLYSTRAKNQGFVNIISENYLLRDYMVDNAPIFTTDSKVIPSIVPDYTRTERNTVVALIMRMFGGEVSETDLKHNLSIAGIEFTDAYEKFRELILKHCDLKNVEIASFFKDEIVGDDMKLVKTPYYTIHNNDTKLADYARNLSNAYFIIEDDKDKSYYLGAMLYGQVFQKYLPGQMLTYSGKYYQVQTITQESGVVLRRAADHITDRRSYRQRREYSLSGFTPDPAMASRRTSRGIVVFRGFCNEISVKTHGYYELTSLDNLTSAHQVDLNNIPDRNYKNKAVLCLKMPELDENARFTVTLLLNEIFITLYPESFHYISATIKRKSDTESNIAKLLHPVQLQDFDDEDAIFIIEDCEIDLGLLVSVERNITRLLEIIADYLAWYEKMTTEPKLLELGSDDESAAGNETDNPPAIADESAAGIETGDTPAIADESTTGNETGDTPAITVETVACDKTDESPSTIEDKSAAANEADETPATEDGSIAANEADETPATEDGSIATNEADNTPATEDGSIAANEADETPATEDESAVGIEIGDTLIDEDEIYTGSEIVDPPAIAGESAVGNETDNTPAIADESGVGTEAVDTPVDSAVRVPPINNEFVIDDSVPDTPLPPRKYSEGYYMLYGYDKLDSILNFKGVLDFLTAHVYNKNALEQARANSDIAARIETETDFSKPDAHFCDFCAVELSGGEYDVLADGRERCIQCAGSAMKKIEQFTRLYENALRNMETFFGIRINAAIKVRMANAKKIAKLCGEKFVPTPGFDGRVLAFAQKSSDGYTIYVENGAPKIAAVANIVHELTHIWQYLNWDDKKIRSHYGNENRLLIYEGMAKWTEIQYLLFLNEISYAKRQEVYTRWRNDEYGQGFIKYADQYPLVYGPGYRKTSPFNKEWPLEFGE